MAEENCAMAAWIIISYTLAVMVPSAIVLRPKVEKRSLSMRLGIYFLCGNTVLSNLVFVLVFCHILYTPVMWAALVALTVVGAFKTRGMPLEDLPVYIINFLLQALGNDLGNRFAIKTIGSALASGLRSAGRWLRKYVLKKPVETVAGVVLTAALLYLYRGELLTSFGYHASDIPVHNYWINEMVYHQKPFAGGLYPFGYHTVLAGMYVLFRIPVMKLLCFFNLAIILYSALFIIILGRGIMRSRFLAFLIPGIWFLGTVFSDWRYTSPLPQEFSILFMITAIIYALDYFRKMKQSVKPAKQDSYAFALALSMCLSSHLYPAIVLFIECVLILVVMIPDVFRKKYLFPLIKAAFLGVAVAGWTFAVGGCMGIPLQGSAQWAMSVAKGEKWNATDDGEEDEEDENQQSEVSITVETDGSLTVSDVPRTSVKELSFKEKLKQKVSVFEDDMASNIYTGFGNYTTAKKAALYTVFLYLAFALFSFVLGIKDRCYGRDLRFVCLSGLAFFTMFSASNIGLPQLMDQGRCACFILFWISLSVTVFVDCVLTFLTDFMPQRAGQAVREVVSAALVCLVSLYAVSHQMIKTSVEYMQLETNGAVTSITDIMKWNRPFTYTVVSANDELRMVEGVGYHVEVADLLDAVENLSESKSFTIPTEKVYFFVEKKPASYYSTVMNEVGKIGKKYAREKLPDNDGLGIYMGENRYIEMSRMYYFVKELEHRFPEHTKVFYEDDAFLCVVLRQDVNAPMNLAFDYGYNK